MQFMKSLILYYKSRENPYEYCKSRENMYQVLQVTREYVSGTTSHARICIRYYKSRENMYQVLQVTRESYQVLQVTCAASDHAIKLKVRMIITIVPSYIGKYITGLLPVAMLLVLTATNS